MNKYIKIRGRTGDTKVWGFEHGSIYCRSWLQYLRNKIKRHRLKGLASREPCFLMVTSHLLWVNGRHGLGGIVKLYGLSPHLVWIHAWPGAVGVIDRKQLKILQQSNEGACIKAKKKPKTVVMGIAREVYKAVWMKTPFGNVSLIVNWSPDAVDQFQEVLHSSSRLFLIGVKKRTDFIQ